MRHELPPRCSLVPVYKKSCNGEAGVSKASDLGLGVYSVAVDFAF